MMKNQKLAVKIHMPPSKKFTDAMNRNNASPQEIAQSILEHQLYPGDSGRNGEIIFGGQLAEDVDMDVFYDVDNIDLLDQSKHFKDYLDQVAATKEGQNYPSDDVLKSSLKYGLKILGHYKDFLEDAEDPSSNIDWHYKVTTENNLRSIENLIEDLAAHPLINVPLEKSVNRTIQ